MSSVIISQPKELIGAFVNEQQGFPAHTSWGSNYNALGLVKNGKLMAGVIYNCYEGANVNMHVGAIDGAKWLTQEFLFAAFDYPFNQLKKRRVTAFMNENNDKAIGFVENLGFTYEGRMRNYFRINDAVIYGMLREECRFLDMRKAA